MNVEVVACRFIGDFKVGDNLVLNGKALCNLSRANADGVFNKLMVIQAGSIVEAALDQVVYRAQSYTREGVPNIAKEDLDRIRLTRIERFNNLIDAMRKYRLLDDLGGGIYDELHELRKWRNRVHIQFDSDVDGASRDEVQAFDEDRVKWSLNLCIRILNFLSARYPRPKDIEQFAHQVEIPVI